MRNSDILQKPLSVEEIKRELGIKEDKVVLSVGRFIHTKGFDILPEAASNISRDVGIYIVGGEPTVEYLKIKAKYELRNVKFAGFKPKDDLKKYYEAADLFVLPTRKDIWGLVINEAMACGLPVITTERCIAGIELVKDNENGFIIPVEDAKQVAVKVEHILRDDTLRINMSRRSLEKIREYTIGNMVETHIKMLQNILAKS